MAMELCGMFTRRHRDDVKTKTRHPRPVAQRLVDALCIKVQEVLLLQAFHLIDLRLCQQVLVHVRFPSC
tara:strand:+ start:1109 stop:1315 length:207 start_codon:yes stop_codon:yes gene_type:complete